MVTLPDLMFVLYAGADSLDRHNTCAECGAERGKFCTDDAGREVAVHPGRVPGDPMLAATLRAMADAARRRY